ncbi:MAG: HAD family hydrolase [Gammaproteobacteria bacterium]
MRAALFDLDGTLIDSETQTDRAIAIVMARHGVPGFALPHTETRGRTWEHVADVIRARTGIGVAVPALAAELLAYWNDATADVKPVSGSPDAVRAAAASGLRLAVVSSSPRSVIDRFLGKLEIDDCFDRRARIGADAVRRSKPDPEGFLLAAGVLDVQPPDALVIEDSRAGLLAASAAGMRSLFITCCAADPAGDAPLATAACTDYRALPPRFWDELATGSRDFAGQSFT